MKRMLRIAMWVVMAMVVAHGVGIAMAAETNSGTAANVGELSVVPRAAVGVGSITAYLGDTSAPPATFGGYTMTPVPYPGAPACTGDTPPIATPGGDLGISPTDIQRCVGSGWATWSHGYLGDVFYTGGGTSQTLTMPSNTGAVYFYVEPNPFSVQTCQAVAEPGSVSTGPFSVSGDSGARFVGFYGESITSITVSCDVDFATGELGWAAAGAACDYTGNGIYSLQDLMYVFGTCMRSGTGGCFAELIAVLRGCGLP